jgi:streptogramin lyase/two-component sensor histidine kinase
MLLVVAPIISAAQSLEREAWIQSPFFEYLGEKEGITAPIHIIRQDQQGFLWCIVQHKGLLRFDGVKVKQYLNNPDDPNSLPTNSIVDMLVAHNGLIWLATVTGLVCFDPILEHFSIIPCPSKIINCISEDHNHRIWAGSGDKGLFFFDPQTNSMVQWEIEFCLDGDTGQKMPKDLIIGFHCLLEDGQGNFWVSIHTESIFLTLAYIDPVAHTLEYYTFSGGNWAAMWGFKLDKDKQCIWIGGFGLGLLQFSIKTHLWQLYDLRPKGEKDPANNYIYDIQYKNDSTLWLATEQGLKVFSTEQKTWAWGNTRDITENKTEKTRYWSVFRDQAGTDWFGTDKGLCKIDPYRQQFPPFPPFPNGFHAQAITEYTPNEELLFACWKESGFFEVFALHKRTGKMRTAKQRLHFQPNDVAAVHQIFVAPDGRIWVLLNRGIGWLDPATLHLSILDKPITNSPTGGGTSNFWPRQMAADKNGILWIATFGSGIIRYTPSTGQFLKPIDLPAMDGSQIEYNYFSTNVYCDPFGKIFLGENGTGLEIWDTEQQSRNLFQKTARNNHSLSGQFVRSIAPDTKGNVWIGTEGGLCRYTPNMPPDSAFEQVKGLQEWVFQIVPDRQDRLWLFNESVMFCYNPQNKTFKKMDKEEGVIPPVFVNYPLYCDSDGKIWRGSDLCFNPADIELYPPVAKPLFTGFKVYDRSRPLALPAHQGYQQVFSEMQLNPDEEVFTIEIGTLGFTAPEQTRLIYRLRPDDPWQEAGTQRSFTFNRLPGGHYRFELSAIGADGTKSEHTVVLPLQVIPPYYRSAWFWGLMGFLFSCGVYFFFRYREIQRLRQEQFRLRIARDLHDEVGSTLSAISILSESALNGLQQDLNAARFGNIGDKARGALNSISDIVWSVNPENDSMEKALARMSAYASELLENVGTELRFEVGAGVSSLSLTMERRRNFYLLFKEAIHNCAKYARAKQVTVSFEKEQNQLIMCVKDDGIGFILDHKSTDQRNLGGNGLRNMNSRAAALGGNLEIITSPGKGTMVQLTMKIV